MVLKQGYNGLNLLIACNAVHISIFNAFWDLVLTEILLKLLLLNQPPSFLMKKMRHRK